MTDPRTAEQWQEAVDLAELYLLVDSAKQYGLVTGGPTIDLSRCEALLRMGGARGVRPRNHEALVREMLPLLLGSGLDQ